MIEIIYIPTRKRYNNQITFNNLPSDLQARVILVVNHDEDLTKYDKKFKVLKLGKDVNTISEVRREIVYHAKDKKFVIVDDDLNFSYHYFEKTDDGCGRKMTEEDYHELFKLMDEKLDTYEFGSLKETCYPPSPDKFGKYPEWNYDGRVMQIVFYNGKTLPKDDVQWTGVQFAEDHYVTIQLLLLGCHNAISQRYNTAPGLARDAPGGCSETRTLELHNNSWKKLAELYPKYVTLREKPDKKSGKARISGRIAWSKLSQTKRRTSTDGKQQKLF